MAVASRAIPAHLWRGRFPQSRRAFRGQNSPALEKSKAKLLRQRLRDHYAELRKKSVVVHKTPPVFSPSKKVASHQVFPPLPDSTLDTVTVKLKAPLSLSRSGAPKNRSNRGWVATFRSSLLLFFVAASVVGLAFLFVPVAYYQFFSADPVPVTTSETGTPLGGKFTDGASVKAGRNIPEPAYDETLPEGNWLIIPRIGVRTEILESETPEESLRKGIWRVPEYGAPGDESLPIILAGHRFGYNWWWKGDYWRYHSFYLLPNLEPGDIIEVISDKRKYMYEIYSGEEGEEIRDYNADMILYTCKLLNSPLRHFRYARLIDPSRSTQPSLSGQISQNTVVK